ncbi:MAG: response regulator, partial [Flavobacteriales bacterium]|nr:response regulator [Flavobacteriales bacterium]
FIFKDLNTVENLPDIIFLDINMPEMDGWEFMDEFIQIQKSLSKKITIYIVSSSIAFQDTEKANRYKEISGYIIKPFQADCLKKILSDV